MTNELTPQAAALKQDMERFFELGALFTVASGLLRTDPDSDELGRLLILGGRLAQDYGGDAWEAFEPSGQDSREPEALA